MRFNRLISLLLLLLLPLTSTIAQDSAAPYTWEAAGLALQPPPNWDAPRPAEAEGQISLEMAQALVDTSLETRPPGIPFITLTIYRDSLPVDANLTPFLFAALQATGIDSLDQPAEVTWLDTTVIELTGTSSDEQFYGIARAVQVGEADVLLMLGRAAAGQQDDFQSIFDSVAGSISTGTEADVTDIVEYGVLWNTLRDADDGDEGLLNLVGLEQAEDNSLYTYELDLGVVRLDAATGHIQSIHPNPNIIEAADLAVTSTGTVYVSDIVCGCVYTLLPDGTWLDGGDATGDSAEIEDEAAEETEAPVDENTGVIANFGPDSPASLAVGEGDILYATNIASTGIISVLVFDNGTFIDEIRLTGDIFEQPLLAATPEGDVLALTQYGEILALAGGRAEEINALGPVAQHITGFAVMPDGSYAIATGDQGILILDAEGSFVAQPGLIVAGFPLPGEFVAPVGVAANADGTLYVADSDGTFGAVTAMSASVTADRLGSAALTPGLEVQGILSTETPQQLWTYTATAGEQITLTAVDNTGIGQVDVALRLLGPDGAEIAFNDDHDSLDLDNFTDAQILSQTLPAAGEYTIQVELMDGEGAYTLGISLTRALIPGDNGISTGTGRLSFGFPVERWTFNGAADQTLTITMEPTSGDLDPILRLIGPDGALIDENDDAEDTSLGTSAQLANIALPADGTYTLEAARFEGTGSYTISLVIS